MKDTNNNAIKDQPRRSSTPDVVDSVARAFNGVIPPPSPMRRSTSCGNEMMSVRSRTAHRDTGRSYLIRESREDDNLLANLMNLRSILLGQNAV